jgi:ppGpp synthetase/RelA/SpoT-type nucleotidyltranferase
VIVAPEITRRFDLASGDLQRLDSRIRDYVMSLCNDCGYAWVGRRKTLVSTAEKIESGRFRAWRDVDDLIAYTIVVPTAMEVPDVLQDLEKRFHKIVIRDGRKTIKAPDVFRFDATRFIGKIDVSPLPEQDASLGDLAFEVQVRTAFEHAWSVTTHALAYKAGMVDWRRQRLAAQLKAAIEQLDALIIGFESATGNVVAQHWPVTACRSKIEDHFRRLLESGVLPSEAAPESWERFSWNML